MCSLRPYGSLTQEAYVRVLLDGGPTRAFSDSDIPLMEEDLSILKVSNFVFLFLKFWTIILELGVYSWIWEVHWPLLCILVGVLHRWWRRSSPFSSGTRSKTGERDPRLVLCGGECLSFTLVPFHTKIRDTNFWVINIICDLGGRVKC